MIKNVFRSLACAILFVTLLLGWSPIPAQGEGQRYYPETGHWVTGDFLTAYLSTKDPIKLYGYPITDAFINQTTGRTVQYFQRAYFELHPESAPELRVQLSRLGEIMYGKYGKGPELPIPDNFPACKMISETNKQICYAFLDFFETNGGIAQFGYPISNIEIHKGRMVQFFQRSLFEWHPEMPAGQRVVLAELGRMYFNERDEDPARLWPSKVNFAPQSILKLQARAFLGKAVLPLKSDQTLYVIVQDQNLQPVGNAQIIVTVRYPSGNEARFVMPPTDKDGIAKVQFPVNETLQGIVEVSITATYDTLEERTRTSFRLWW